ncbi:hypothetical protein LY90DRAFT_507012 [Neocallimastix californiae]|uniref:Uncharacterized protein n=1 Tax=Neocallimastix californiae TaxID=1754190 RepID=A0A1Y2D976_9FUNG|nr:hypothetical protein LY90DRAFT_507012 [Neocallimastix californiae]|eukprot:ORY55803.1 hypothetical protein LY90DRAFT_507012 [Neocallimastix californiae]
MISLTSLNMNNNPLLDKREDENYLNSHLKSLSYNDIIVKSMKSSIKSESNSHIMKNNSNLPIQTLNINEHTNEKNDIRNNKSEICKNMNDDTNKKENREHNRIIKKESKHDISSDENLLEISRLKSYSKASNGSSINEECHSKKNTYIKGNDKKSIHNHKSAKSIKSKCQQADSMKNDEINDNILFSVEHVDSKHNNNVYIIDHHEDVSNSTSKDIDNYPTEKADNILLNNNYNTNIKYLKTKKSNDKCNKLSPNDSINIIKSLISPQRTKKSITENLGFDNMEQLQTEFQEFMKSYSKNKETNEEKKSEIIRSSQNSKIFKENNNSQRKDLIQINSIISDINYPIRNKSQSRSETENQNKDQKNYQSYKITNHNSSSNSSSDSSDNLDFNIPTFNNISKWFSIGYIFTISGSSTNYSDF